MKGRPSFVFASLVALASITPALPVQAQLEGPSAPSAPPSSNPSDNRALAEMLFFTARGLMEAGRYAEACGKLQESYRLDPAAGTLLNMAVCHQKIGKIASAWGEFREAAADAKRMNRPDREQLASEQEAALEPELPFLAINVPPEVARTPGLVITRNGVPLMSAAWNTELPVDPGQVEIVEKAPGYKPKTLYVTIANKEHKAMSVESLVLKPVEIPPQPFWTAARGWGLVLIGAGAVATGFGVYTGLTAIDDKNNSQNNCKPVQGEPRCNSTGVDDASHAQTWAWVTDGLIGAAIVSAGVGTYLMVTGGPSSKEHAPSPAPLTGIQDVKFRVGPTLGGASGVLTGSF